MSDHTYKSGDRVRLRKLPDVEGTIRFPFWRDKYASVTFDFCPESSSWLPLDAIEPVPSPTFDPADLREGDIVDAEGTPNVRGYTINRVWRLDENGDYRLIFPPREVQR